MPLFELTPSSIAPVAKTTFQQEQIKEREHLQTLLRERIEVVVPDVLVVAEEFGEFEDANRRIDLLGLDRSGRLVVIELKRTEDGGHMELQALRYAAMVRTMTLGRLYDVYDRHLELHPDGRDADARERILEWLEDADEVALATDVKIVLVSADFGREITGTVLWLNEYGLDIRCVRMVPYRLDDRLLLDVQQVIPLPESTDYQVQIRQKQALTKASSGTTNHDYTKFIVTDANGQEWGPLAKRQAIIRMAHAVTGAGVSAASVCGVLKPSKVRRLGGAVPVDEVEGHLLTADEDIDLGRWFTAEPLVDSDATFVISKMWGLDTPTWLAKMAALAPGSAVSFAAHEGS